MSCGGPGEMTRAMAAAAREAGAEIRTATQLTRAGAGGARDHEAPRLSPHVATGARCPPGPRWLYFGYPPEAKR
jgi:phytoene dehydrogenase-like protein